MSSNLKCKVIEKYSTKRYRYLSVSVTVSREVLDVKYTVDS